MAKPTYSAVLLAGGKSRRMGQDKALLPWPDASGVLWQRQLRVLEELNPAEIFWSGPPRPGLPAHLQLVADVAENAGPLAGISACLEILRSDLLVVLAIDLPHMNAAFLQNLLAQSSPTRGAVVRHEGYFEPLAAVYPRRLHALAVDHLRQKRHALQALIREALPQDLMKEIPFAGSDVPLFRNMNVPADLK